MKFLIAVDASLVSKQAVAFIADRPALETDSFMILSVVAQVAGTDSHKSGVARKESFESQEKLVEEFALQLKEHFPENAIETKVVGGTAAEQIVSWARQWGADMIVLGTHGRKGFDKLRYGSVAEAVLKESDCSVRIVKARHRS
ncbi:MAG: universal stress protein [Candidatus Obscuribacterales bacterium]